MNIYLASSFSLVYRVEELSKVLEEEGYIITCKWWSREYEIPGEGKVITTELKKRYNTDKSDVFYNRPETEISFKSDVKGIEQCDVLIFVADKEPKSFNGANVELGITIGLNKPRIIYGNLVNSAMYYGTYRCLSVDELLLRLKIIELKI